MPIVEVKGRLFEREVGSAEVRWTSGDVVVDISDERVWLVVRVAGGVGQFGGGGVVAVVPDQREVPGDVVLRPDTFGANDSTSLVTVASRRALV
jgi:hypothetical protein